MLSLTHLKLSGYVAKDRDWRWCLWASAIINGVTFVTILFSCPRLYLIDLMIRHKKSSLTTRHKSSKLKTFRVHGNPTTVHLWRSKLIYVACGFGTLTARPHAKSTQKTSSSDRSACSNTHLSFFQRSTCTYLHCAHCISINHLTRCPVEKFCDLRACPNRTGIDISPPIYHDI